MRYLGDTSPFVSSGPPSLPSLFLIPSGWLRTFFWRSLPHSGLLRHAPALGAGWAADGWRLETRDSDPGFIAPPPHTFAFRWVTHTHPSASASSPQSLIYSFTSLRIASSHFPSASYARALASFRALFLSFWLRCVLFCCVRLRSVGFCSIRFDSAADGWMDGRRWVHIVVKHPRSSHPSSIHPRVHSTSFIHFISFGFRHLSIH